MKNDFDTWWGEASFIEDDGCYQEKYLAAKEAWEEKDNQLEEVIGRLENYPCCMSCYLTKEEMFAARNIKERFIEILKEELL
ncbi:hypothetical protein [Pseudoalteromonas phage J2-1]|uniref:Uncharacterized protein n=1 Tax=Pseudoalteromonas phage J2-1 TaxID=2023998 RepID=A0A223LHW7_9CAUD|nr:hypothetical protein HOR90_gp21 [Pseudoalteromonas phage J2-1]ASU03308.1 hypothetical protein [Pseudoalteromonas phage J2-1]